MIADLINLDDRTYADLVAEARASIPSLSPNWTDHNESDPGIILLEMFAWLTELVGYRLNRIPDSNYWTFLQLLNEPGWTAPSGTDLESAIRQTITLLRDRDRAITGDDFEYLILTKWPRSTDAAALPLGAAGAVTRIRYLPEINRPADGSFPDVDAPGHVSVVLLNRYVDPTQPSAPFAYGPPPGSAVWSGLAAYLDARRLLTTKVHLVQARVVPLSVTATIYLLPDAVAATVHDDAIQTLQNYLDPQTGGRDGTGRALGQNLYLSEIYAQLTGVAGVDYVDGVQLAAPLRAGVPASIASRALPDGLDLADSEVATLPGQNAAFTMMQKQGSLWKPVQL